MIIKELFEGPVGDYRIDRNTIKCLLLLVLYFITIYEQRQTIVSHRLLYF